MTTTNDLESAVTLLANARDCGLPHVDLAPGFTVYLPTTEDPHFRLLGDTYRTAFHVAASAIEQIERKKLRAA